MWVHIEIAIVWAGNKELDDRDGQPVSENNNINNNCNIVSCYINSDKKVKEKKFFPDFEKELKVIPRPPSNGGKSNKKISSFSQQSCKQNCSASQKKFGHKLLFIDLATFASDETMK